MATPQNVSTSTTPAEIQQQAIEKAEGKTALDRIRAYAEMDEVKKRFINLLGDRDGKAYVESVVIAVANKKELQACTPKSIMISAMRAASLKLSLDPILEQAHLVAYGTEATLIPDYHGLVQLSVNTNYYEIAPNVEEVWEGEEVKTERFTGRVIVEGKRVSDVIIGWVAYYKAKNGIERWLYMSNEECDQHGATYNPGGYKNAKSPWNAHNGRDRDKMRRKTCLRTFVRRWGNFSPQVQSLIMNDEVINTEAFDMPDDNIKVNAAPDLKTNTAANVSILTGVGNPDPVKDDTWADWLEWKERARVANVFISDPARMETTDNDLREYMIQIAPHVLNAEQTEPA
jgi:recombination protein RecT